MRLWHWVVFILPMTVLHSLATDPGADPANRYAWGENIGWVSAQSAQHDLTVHFDGTAGWLAGWLWGENVGWIKIGAGSGGPYANRTADDWGVNMDAVGNLTGYAFDHTTCDAAINPTNGAFSGHAWCENTGWVTFRGASPDYGVRCLAFDTQSHGTPNWWLDHHGVGESSDPGDGVPAWQKYVMDTDPHDMGSCLQITAVSNAASTTTVAFSPTSVRRYYTLWSCTDAESGAWSNLTGHGAVSGAGGQQFLTTTNAPPRAFYRVRVRLTP